MSLTDRNSSISEEEHCNVDLNETSRDLVENREKSSAVIELPGDSSRAEDELRGDVDTAAAGRGREMKLAWRGRAKHAIKTALVDLRLFLW